MSVPPSHRFDVVVVGGGPAGASCALRLARYGFDVALVDRDSGADGAAKRQHVGESLPSSSRVLFEELGIELGDDVFVKRPPEHLVFWGPMRGSRPWTDVPERESSLLVWRGPFDDLLRRAAATHGARLLNASAKAVTAVDDRRRIETTTEGELEARVVVDATGRAGILARELRRKESRFRTLALTGHYRTEEDAPPTIVEALEDGWVWSAPLQNGLRDVTVMVDAPERRATSDREALFHRCLARAANVRSLLGEAPLEGAIRGIDATPYDARLFCGPDFFLAGDAASFLDPLSAHGVHKALDDALAAAVAIRTRLERPASLGDVVEFYQERLSSIYRVTTERLRRLYGQEERFADREFWRRRSFRVGSSEESSAPGSDRAPLRPLRPLREGAVLVASAGVSLAEASVLEGDFIERRPVLRGPGHERPIRFLGSICLPELYREVVAGGEVYEIARRSPQGFSPTLAAIDWLYRAGYLEPRRGTEL